MRFGFVVASLFAVGTEDILQRPLAALEDIGAGLPLRLAGFVDGDNGERVGKQRLRLLEDADLHPLDESRVVGVGTEAHDVGGLRAARLADRDRGRIGGDAQSRLPIQVVEVEADLRVVQRDVGAALDVRGAAPRIVDRLAVDGDPHHVELVGTLRLKLTGDRRDVDTLVVVERQRLVVDGLNTHERSVALEEPGVHDVVGLDVAAPFVLGLGLRQLRILEKRLHRAPRACRGKTDVVPVDRRGAALQAFVRGVPDEPQARVGAVRDLGERALQGRRVAGGNDRYAVFELESGDRTPRRFVHLGHINVADTTPPLNDAPPNVDLEWTIGLDTSPATTGAAIGTDACDPNPAVVFTDVRTPGACNGDFSIVRTWTVIDECGNSATAVQDIDVADTTPPDITCPVDVVLDCGDSTDPVETGEALTSDTCDPNPVLGHSDDVMGSCGGSTQTIDRTWTSTDECGNSASCVQEIVSLPSCLRPREPLPLGICQLPDGENAYVSELDSDQSAEFFTPTVDFEITVLRWWGVYFQPLGGDCGPGPGDAFEVTYYLDAGGVPGAVHAGPFPIDDADLVKCSTGETLHVGPGITLGEWQYEAPIPPVHFDAGVSYWVEIANDTSGDPCGWRWSTAAPGDDFAHNTFGGPVEDDLAFCFNTIRRTCRSAGYYSTHSHDEKDGSQNVTQDLLDAAHCIEVCDEVISTTNVDDANSAIEGLCVKVQGTDERQLARQLIALGLNCIASGYGPDCEGWPGVEQLFEDCNMKCEPQSQPWGITVGECIDMVSCINEGGDPFSQPGSCFTGTCSDNGRPCSDRDRSNCTSPTLARCLEDLDGCHAEEICNPGVGVCVPPGTSADPSNCKRARASACTILEVGRTTESRCTDGIQLPEEDCVLLDGGAFSPVTEDITPCAPAKDEWQFEVRAGETVEIGADTVDAGTAADLRFSVFCDTGDFLVADDEQPCTFPPPFFACPLGSFVASADGLCQVTVDVFDSVCSSEATANYELSVTRDGAHAPLLLTGDDIVPPGLSAPALQELTAAGLDQYVGDFTPLTSDPLADGWTRHTFDTDGGSGPVCVAGTPFTTFTKPGDPNKVLVFLQGGGACWQDFYFCSILADTNPPPLAGPVSGIWIDTVDNPFAGWSVVYVSYCDGSVFTGDNDVVDANFPFGPVRFHRGVRNLTAALDLADATFPGATEVVIAGSAAGGTGASTFAPLLARFVFGNAVDLSVFGDASKLTPINLGELGAIASRAADWDFGKFFPASCAGCSDTGQTTAILDWRLSKDLTVRDAYYVTDGDATNRFFLNVPTQAAYRTLVLTEHGLLNAAYPTRYKRLVRSGDDEHTVLQLSTFYTGDGDGVPIHQWTADFVTDAPGWVDIVEDFVPIP